MSVPLLLQAIALNLLIVAVAWRKRAYVLYLLESCVYFLQGQSARRKVNKYLADNFKPVSAETAHQDLKVVGKLPKALDGVYARTGPNPVLPITGDYHWYGAWVILCNCMAQLVLDQEARPSTTAVFLLEATRGSAVDDY